MARSLFDQETQVHSSGTYTDSTAPTEAAFETNPTELQTDLNNIRSMLHELRDVRNSNWWAALTAPTTFTGDSGHGVRGVQDTAQDLWDVERKRVLVSAVSLADVTVGGSDNFVILGSGELPPNTTAAVGAVTTLGTVTAAHGGTFGAHDLSEVVGSSAINPKNMVEVVSGSSRDPILDSSARRIWGLLQGESGLTDGTTITTSTTTRAQVSFVVINTTGDDLIACVAADIQGQTVNFAFNERKALADLTEQDFLRGAIVDVPGAATVTRQVAYNNQGTTPVDLTTNATLDLEGAGVVWSIRDDAEAALFTITEGSAGSSTNIAISGDVDTYVNDALDVDFDQGISVNTGGSRPIDIGETDGVIESTTGDLEVQAAAELILSDGNESVGWSRNGILLSDSGQEWDDFEAEFGEVSLLDAIVQAKQNANRASVWAAVNADISADTNVTGAGGTPNITAQMPNYSGLTFVSDVEVFVNGQKQRPGADAAANNDVYPGTSASNGDLMFEYALKYRGGSNPDNINVVVWGEPT